MRILKTIYFPVRKGSSLRVIRKFSLNHRLTAALGAFTLAIVLIQVVSSIIEIVRRKGNAMEAEMLDMALKAFQTGNLNKALNIVSRAGVLYPNSHSALYLKGVIYLQKKQYEEAKDCFQKAVRLNSAMGEYHLGLSIAMFHLGKLHDSLESMKKAEEMMGEDAFNQQLKEAGLAELRALLNADLLTENLYNN